MSLKASGWLEFHKNRKLIIKDVPPVTYKDIREYLGTIQASDIIISKRHKHVIVTLTHGEHADQHVVALAARQLLGKNANVSLYPRRMMLSILGIPLQLDDGQFRRFIEQFGPVEICFLMRGATGMSKGYGFVEFAHNRVTTDRVRALITAASFPSSDGVVRKPMSCDYVPDCVLRYDDLHSRTVVFLDYLGTPGGATTAPGAAGVQPVVVSRGVMTANGRNRNFVTATYRNVAEAERAWSLMGGVHARGLPVCSFAMPGLDANQVAKTLSSQPPATVAPSACVPSNSDRTTPSDAVKRFSALFPGKTELTKAFEKFLFKVVDSLNGEPLTNQAVDAILNLVAKPGSENVPPKRAPPVGREPVASAGVQQQEQQKVQQAIQQQQVLQQQHKQQVLQQQQQQHAYVLRNPLSNTATTAVTVDRQDRAAPVLWAWQNAVSGFHQQPTNTDEELQFMPCSNESFSPMGQDLSIPGCGYEALPSASGPITRNKRRSGTLAGIPSVTSAPAAASPYTRHSSSEKQRATQPDRCFIFEASLEEALSYVSAHKQSTLTPRLLRAASRLLPEPEPSPEGRYIGQHSQGIGGHYAESYWARKGREQQQHVDNALVAPASPRLQNGGNLRTFR